MRANSTMTTTTAITNHTVVGSPRSQTIQAGGGWSDGASSTCVPGRPQVGHVSPSTGASHRKHHTATRPIYAQPTARSGGLPLHR